MYCNRLHAWWSTKSWLVTLLSSLIARWWVGLQTLWRFRLKDLSIDELVGALCFDCLSGPPGFTFWISFALVFSYIYCWVLIFALSPFYILIYMSRRWCIDNKGDDFDFEIVTFQFLDGGVPPSTTYGVYISQLIRFARTSSHVQVYMCFLVTCLERAYLLALVFGV